MDAYGVGAGCTVAEPGMGTAAEDHEECLGGLQGEADMGGVCAHGVGGGLRLCGDGMPDLGLLACDTETEGAVDGLLAAVAEPVHLGVSY